MRPDIPILALTPTIRNARYLTLVKNIVPAVLDPRYKKENKKGKHKNLWITTSLCPPIYAFVHDDFFFCIVTY
jgi:hypothetical protein